MSQDVKPENFSKHFSNDSFWSKLKKFGKKAGVSVVYVALLLFYTLQKPTTPVWAKTVIISVLGYFILPVDLFPDLLPAGYTDDMSGLFGALVTVAMFIDDEVKYKAKERVRIWFGDQAVSETETVDDKMNKKVNQEDKEKDED
ncbi:YkvA family protein [Metabacillus schmidteae]|uniref:YkvA family protein n=1 Tax=Metabacillus schmidteae TaxID=2730405 RepID=UPI00158917E7|nr:YkvA family protein [Metabacillus schmidteae]